MRLPRLLVKLGHTDAFREAQRYNWLLIASHDAKPGEESNAAWVQFSVKTPMEFEQWVFNLFENGKFTSPIQYFRAYDRSTTFAWVRQADEEGEEVLEKELGLPTGG